MARPVWAAPDHGTYIVRRGDTLFSIARRHGTNVETLQRLNGLSNPNQIRAGQVLIVPDAGDGNALVVSQPQSNAPTSSTGTIPSTGACIYTVQRGDYLYKIARKFGISPLQLARANGLSGSSGLIPGQVLRVPTSQCGAANPPRELALQPSRPPLLPTPTPLSTVPQLEPDLPPAPTPIPQLDNGSRVKISEPTPTPTPPIRPEVYD
ncbi:MAG: LysM peptidoglycan-binding domain-containing protein [Anaerolineae bacterium]|nr:LysM peptidoglycan-binding domain-containing protein [Anaerolineae bacterium]